MEQAKISGLNCEVMSGHVFPGSQYILKRRPCSLGRILAQSSFDSAKRLSVSPYACEFAQLPSMVAAFEVTGAWAVYVRGQRG